MNPVLRFARAHLPYAEKTERGADVPLSYDEIRAWGGVFLRLQLPRSQAAQHGRAPLGLGQGDPFAAARR